MIDLPEVYRRALEDCAPESLMRRVARADLPRAVVAIGKCAGPLLDGLANVDQAFVAIPAGYPRPKRDAIVFEGGHPEMTAASFAAGRALLEFVDAHRDITFLISGGGSACVELPLDPFSEDELIRLNGMLIRSGEPIAAINCVRKHVSAIKGGRLAERVRGRNATFIYSDVGAHRLADVASGPTLADPSTRDEAIAVLQRIGVPEMASRITIETPKRLAGEVELIASNETLVAAAARHAESFSAKVVTYPEQIESDVSAAAEGIGRAASALRSGEVLVAGGEPTVPVTGSGLGGRCTELALRFALAAPDFKGDALFASSDGVDGSSGAAGVFLRLPAALDPAEAGRALNASNSAPIAARIGRLLPMCPTGNNLRDLYLLACS